MDEFNPIKKEKLDKSFFKSYIYILVLAVIGILGSSFGLTFFTRNVQIGSMTYTLDEIDVTVTGNMTINATLESLSDTYGIKNGYTKTITVTNNNTSQGMIDLVLERTSGLALTNLKYAIIYSNAVQEIGNVPSDGTLLSNAFMGNDILNLTIKLWIDEDYSGTGTNFVGNVQADINRLPLRMSGLIKDTTRIDNTLTTSDNINYYYSTSATNNYVTFNKYLLGRNSNARDSNWSKSISGTYSSFSIDGDYELLKQQGFISIEKK